MSVSPATDPQDWMVLQCRKCGSRMKSRRATALSSRLLCPKCHTPVPLQMQETEMEADAGRQPEFQPGPQSFQPRGAAVIAADTGKAQPSATDFTAFKKGGSAIPPSGDGELKDLREDGEHPEFSGASAFDAKPVAEEADVHAEAEKPGEAGSKDEEERGMGIIRRLRRRRKKKRAKRKRVLRVKYAELADWNSSDLLAIPEAEVGADIWAEAVPLPEEMEAEMDEQVYLVEEIDENGNKVVRRKKMRRGRLVRGAQLFFRRFVTGSRYFTGGLAVLIAAAGIYGLYVLRQKFTEPEPIPFAERGTVDPSILTRANEQAAEAVVRGFLQADGVAAKAAFVRHPDRVRPLMEEWYRRSGNSAAPVEAGEITDRRKDRFSGSYFIMLAMPVRRPDPEAPGGIIEEDTYFSVEEMHKLDGTISYLLDWETSTGYQSMPLEAFKAEKPLTSKIFRLKMRPSDYYNHGFTEKDWHSVELYYPHPTQEFHLFGYISRTSIEGRELMAQMEGYQQPALIVELMYPPDAVSSEQVIVKRMVHTSWFYTTEEQGFRAETAGQ